MGGRGNPGNYGPPCFEYQDIGSSEKNPSQNNRGGKYDFLDFQKKWVRKNRGIKQDILEFEKKKNQNNRG